MVDIGSVEKWCHARRIDSCVERSESDCADTARDQAYGGDPIGAVELSVVV